MGTRASRALSAGLVALAAAAPALAQQPIDLRLNLHFYGDNTEFHNPFREGETLFGVAGRLATDITIGDRVNVVLGVFVNRRFGSEKGFDAVEPLASLVVRGGASRLVIGSLDAASARVGLGPDREGPHGLLPPLERETLSFERPHEAGLLWTIDAARLRQEMWLNWQRLNTPAHRERFDAGVNGRFPIVRAVAVGYQAHIVHHGGQLFASGPVADSVAAGPGVIIEAPIGALDRASLETYGLVSRWVPDREQPARARHGVGMFIRGAAERAGWRGHLIVWRACDYVKEEGDPNYLSIRRSGARYHGVRDYSEVGLARTFDLARGVRLETSARLHRIERHYEYSYRVVAVADLSFRVLKDQGAFACSRTKDDCARLK